MKRLEKWYSNNFFGGGCLYTKMQAFSEHFVTFSWLAEKRTN